MTGVFASNVVCKFSDDVELSISVAPGQSVLESALESDLPLMHQCRSGACGSCVAKVVSGEVEMRTGVATSLLAGEQSEGLRLLCVSEAHTDAVIEFDYPSTLSGPTQVSGFVDSLEWLATDVAHLVLELAEDNWLDFKPGQFVRIRVPGSDEWRSYSMVSTKQALPRLEFLIRCLPDGKMSEYLHSGAAVDQVLELEGPFGSFYLRDDLRADHVMIAGGTGVAPMVSMLDTIRQKSGRKPKMLLSFGCLDESSLFFTEELELRTFWMRTLETRISLDKVDGDSDYTVGNPVEAVQADDVSENTVAYLCGPPPMIDAAFSHLESLGLRAENIHAEQFLSSE